MLSSGLHVFLLTVIRREAGRGFVEYDKYVQEIFDREKKKLEAGNDSSNNLISVLLRAAETDDKESPQSGSLTVAEVKGNCFIFTVAGKYSVASAEAPSFSSEI